MEVVYNHNIIHEIYSEDETRLGLAKRLPLHSLATLIKAIWGSKFIFLRTQCIVRFCIITY